MVYVYMYVCSTHTYTEKKKQKYMIYQEYMFKKTGVCVKVKYDSMDKEWPER